ncbi:response regulator [Sulfitobacter aestuariivivens]|uniref:Response regulator n=1 Tax=Sulfitobacter aestuariivivens TaxID=2766981 RepID=A0A927HH91_9RHOB|nr:response regulator [Sulfitobacter aestuariivivens]MBD3666234.1 response regulator [Sulfitobacter aestuariivivens]
MFEGLKILYLEDEPLVALDTSEHLEELGFSSVEAVSRLQRAEDLVAETTFDLALLDINVDRGQTSLELGEMLVEKGTCVVFASGNSSAAISLARDEYHFLDKPFSLAQLTQKLADALQRQTV